MCMLKPLLLILAFLFSFSAFAQTDSIGRRDSSLRVKDTNLLVQDTIKHDSILTPAINKPLHIKARTWQEDTVFTIFFKGAFFTSAAKPVFRIDEKRMPQNKDELFYLLTGLVLFLGFVQVTFSKYFQNIFRLFFQTSFLQKQKRETLLQDNLPSLLLNTLFVITGGLFITLVLQQQLKIEIFFWRLLFYAAGLLAAIYIVKYLFITFAGWVFNEREAANTYIFIVFLINKILGIFLIPLLLVFAFSTANIANVIITLTAFLAMLLLLYRYAVSLTIIKRNMKVKPLHFFIYLCAVELVPLLIIYKVLSNGLSSSSI